MEVPIAFTPLVAGRLSLCTIPGYLNETAWQRPNNYLVVDCRDE